MGCDKSVEVKIGRDPLDIGYPLYARAKVVIEPGLTVLVGCNGAGKSTFIHMCKAFVKKGKRKNAVVFEYDNLTDGTQTNIGWAMLRGDADEFASLALSSEGEGMYHSFGNFVREIGAQVRGGVFNGKDEAWLLIDALDSGLSIDNIVDVKDFFAMLQEMNPNVTFYIIVAANGYELARGERCLDVAAMKYREFSAYDEYRDFILKSRKKRNALSEKSDNRK